MTWLKENWFKAALLVGLFGLVYVLYIGLIVGGGQQPANTENALRLAKQCKDDGTEYFQADKDTATAKRREPGVIDCYYMKPAYVFNKELNTCLYSGGYSCDLENKVVEGIFKGQPAVRWERHIIDIYSNKVLADTYIENSDSVEEWESVLIDSFWEDYETFGF